MSKPIHVKTGASKPSKKILSALGKIFAAEIDGMLPYQSRVKIYEDLIAAGLVESMHRRSPKGFWVEAGYALTEKGRMLYCSNCQKDAS